MTTKEILIAARKMIAKPRGWTKGTFENPDTGSVCAVGAISKAAFGCITYNNGRCSHANGQEFHKARRLLDEVSGCNDIVSYNDSHSKKCVLAAFDAAIEKAEG